MSPSSNIPPSPAVENIRPGDGSERCVREQDEILNRSDVVDAICVCGEIICICPGVKAWLVTLGLEDWECEKRLIEAGR